MVTLKAHILPHHDLQPPGCRGSLAGWRYPTRLMLPRFADIFQQGNRWLNWLEKQPEGSVRPVVTESVTKIMACGTTLMGYTQWCCSSPDCCHTKKICFRCKAAPVRTAG